MSKYRQSPLDPQTSLFNISGITFLLSYIFYSNFCFGILSGRFAYDASLTIWCVKLSYHLQVFTASNAALQNHPILKYVLKKIFASLKQTFIFSEETQYFEPYKNYSNYFVFIILIWALFLNVCEITSEILSILLSLLIICFPS